MNTSFSAQSLLEQAFQIKHMEHGTLCAMGQGPNGPYFNLNSWEDGKNCCRYVPKDKVPAVQKAIEGYHQYQQLTQAYARQLIDKTRAELKIDFKKKPNPKTKSHPKSAKPRKTNSSR